MWHSPVLPGILHASSQLLGSTAVLYCVICTCPIGFHLRNQRIRATRTEAAQNRQ